MHMKNLLGSMVCAGSILLLGLCSCERSGPAGAQAPPAAGTARSSERPPLGAVRLEGTPEQIGSQHGTLLADRIRIMIDEYVGDDARSGKLDDRLRARVTAMKESLPDWYRRELAACARAAGVDEDVLLFAQCEGDVRDLRGCTVYVAFGGSTHDRRMEIGRNFDYWGLESTDACVVVLAVVPRKEDGHAFVSVGWAGILGGWTFLNEKGVFVANSLGGGAKTNPKGVPTLILERIIAQKAGSLDEAVELVRSTPRMRGQGLVIGCVGDAEAHIPPDAVVVEYDAESVEVSPDTNGLAFQTSIGTSREVLLRILRRPERSPTEAICSVGTRITLHSVAIRPQDHSLWVAHGRRPSAHLGEYVKYDIRSLLQRR